MKLLFDQNLSFRLVAALADAFPGSAHVRDFGLSEAADSAVWEHAKRQGFTIVSKDTDFEQRALLLGHPPKVIWIRLGNCTTDAVAALLRAKRQDLEAVAADAAASFLALSNH
jgi:predicted nuclease of predicted toxin-antitoxin system